MKLTIENCAPAEELRYFLNSDEKLLMLGCSATVRRRSVILRIPSTVE